MSENFFRKNIKLLRKRRGRTQEDVSRAMNMKRPTFSGYENGVAEPNIAALLAFSKYYKISVDTLVKTDLSQLSNSVLSQLERGYDPFIIGSRLRVLTTTVDQNNVENIELVPEKASAGYRTGFADPEYIKILPAFQLPFLSREKKYRTFQIKGDSMLPIPDGSYVTGEFVQDWKSIRDGYPHIILTMDDGIVFKIVENKVKDERQVVLHSLNPLYDPYSVDIKDVREVWRFVHYISSEMPERNLPKPDVESTLNSLKQEVAEIKAAVQGKLF